MNIELQNKLYKKYPKLFKQKDLPMTQTCMCWGICTGDGWYWIIDNLCNCVQSYIDNNEKDQIEITQVKEKFGSLRFYTSYSNQFINGMICLSEHYSWNTCENCGSINNIIHTKGWISTLCKDCIEKRNKKED
ncbi:MAG: hypothetical protein U9Q27_03375 [Patescibacteria group bacterium]|nr:hypothetical protein [Patescibacteria group bacterium]